MPGHSFQIFIDQDFQGKGSLLLPSERGRSVSKLKPEELAPTCTAHLPVCFGGGEGEQN